MNNIGCRYIKYMLSQRTSSAITTMDVKNVITDSISKNINKIMA